jgi:hypothetical protein
VEFRSRKAHRSVLAFAWPRAGFLTSDTCQPDVRRRSNFPFVTVGLFLVVPISRLLAGRIKPRLRAEHKWASPSTWYQWLRFLFNARASVSPFFLPSFCPFLFFLFFCFFLPAFEQILNSSKFQK